jgi:hypothetical protein
MNGKSDLNKNTVTLPMHRFVIWYVFAPPSGGGCCNINVSWENISYRSRKRGLKVKEKEEKEREMKEQ